MKNLIIILLLSSLFSCESTKENLTNKNEIQDYQLVWSDEFDYNGLPDSTKWGYDVEGNKEKWGNEELQAYTAKRKENAVVKDGHLFITALKEEYVDTVHKEMFDYTSARLNSKGKGEWKYGKFVIKAKLPSGNGTWPAFWMLPQDWKYGDWPNSGSINIMEHVGHDKDNVYGAANTEAYNHNKGTEKMVGIYIANAEEAFHEYMLEWDPEGYSVYVDNEKYFHFRNENKTYKEWPFDEEFYLLLNLAVGGTWGAQKGVDDDIWPQQLVIDYVRVYQKPEPKMTTAGM
ncbi:glycoside hydrolase family 16 protein [Flammeovirga aprica]|uniref:Glycoside hydrolase family 16 protein n=1 Tax=Flammeovirga aprica JL-4 TaxID=694437 RepID=A0A7X9RWH3_9BACT|nr:glycoside hydrolase family 16 protein [Flammeovirga aprica]NME70005.1 glycoside hydrolase family 16 protein [Flammeovirga aprica JL-4]